MSFHYEEFHGGWFNNQPQNAYVENNIVPYSLAKIKENDQHFIENWLAQTKVKGNRKQTSNNSPSIPELKAYISNVLKVCRDIKKLQEDLKENVSVLSSEEWGEKTALVNKWKGELNQMGSWKSEGTCELLNKKLAKRLSKRARLRRRKDKLKLQKIEEDLARTKRTGEINQWLNKMKEEIDNKKMVCQHCIISFLKLYFHIGGPQENKSLSHSPLSSLRILCRGSFQREEFLGRINV